MDSPWKRCPSRSAADGSPTHRFVFSEYLLFRAMTAAAAAAAAAASAPLRSGPVRSVDDDATE
jgi:hypothetical protein